MGRIRKYGRVCIRYGVIILLTARGGRAAHDSVGGGERSRLLYHTAHGGGGKRLRPRRHADLSRAKKSCFFPPPHYESECVRALPHGKHKGGGGGRTAPKLLLPLSGWWPHVYQRKLTKLRGLGLLVADAPRTPSPRDLRTVCKYGYIIISSAYLAESPL